MNALAVVTGTTSGIGQALATLLLERGWRVFGVARRPATIPEDARYSHVRVDLSDIDAVTDFAETRLRPLVTETALNRVGLVNNAALVALLGLVPQIDPAALQQVYAANVTAPILLMGRLHRYARAGQRLRIVNVSSGAAVQPLPGLGAYGSSKAALRLAGMVFASELEAARESGPDTSILSYEPGVVDTPMQTAVRSSSAETVPSVAMFKEFKSSGALVPPERPARDIASYLQADRHSLWEERRLQ